MRFQNELTIEICVDGFDMALSANRNGVSRLELCTSLAEGGITPPLSLIEKVCSGIPIPVHVMIRPRGGDFLYSKNEFGLMKADIRHAKNAGAAGVVFGILRSDGTIDRDRCKELVELAAPMSVTFHRAFDMTSDPFFALEEIIAIGCTTLLTSGHRQTAEDGLELIRELVKRSVKRIQVMAGGGVGPGNILLLHEAGVRAFHFTCRKRTESGMLYRCETLSSMGSLSANDEYGIHNFDEEKFNGVINALSSA